MSSTMTRPCPSCGQPLGAASLMGEQVAPCTVGDHGCWFPSGSLECALASLRARKRTSPPPFREEGVATLAPGAGGCPSDGASLDRVIWGDAVFARCPRCRGLWVGGDALQIIIAEVRGERVDPRPRDPEDSVLLAILASICP